MKKAVSLILALVICFSMCACGNQSSNNENSNNENSKFVGTYEGNAAVLASVSEPYNGSTLYKSEFIHGKRVITLNADGTGTFSFKPTETANFTNKAVFDEMCNGTISWQEDGNYLTITFYKVTYEDVNHYGYMSDIRREVTETITFELKGATLVSVTGSWSYTKVN